MTVAKPAIEPQSLDIYTDGGCEPNPGPGGWGAVLVWGNQNKELSGADPQTTNNRMELTAAIEALRTLKRRCQIALHTDSQYLKRGITEWVDAWQARGWLKSNKRPVENSDLWQALVAEVVKHDISWYWVKGHAGHPLNERADRLATAARHKLLRAQGSVAAKASPAANAAHADVTIICRGCALGSPGAGGYAAIIRGPDDSERPLSGGQSRTTNNIMELTAAILALEALEPGTSVSLHSLSMYLVRGAGEWLDGWRSNGWRTKAGKPVSNRALWQRLERAMAPHRITWNHLDKTDPMAEKAYHLARAEAKRLAH